MGKTSDQSMNKNQFSLITNFSKHPFLVFYTHTFPTLFLMTRSYDVEEWNKSFYPIPGKARMRKNDCQLTVLGIQTCVLLQHRNRRRRQRKT